MKTSNRFSGPARRAPACLYVLFLALQGPVLAQIGQGPWTEYTPRKNIQLRGTNATYKDSAGVEVFTMLRGDERAEMRVLNDYRTDVHQFEGYVRVTEGQGTSVHQIFKFLMLVAYPDNGGELRQHSYQKLGTTGVFGKWVKVNTVHDTRTHRAEIFIEGVLKGAMADKSPDSPDGWYFKYGVYNTANSSKSEWRGVRYFSSTAVNAGGGLSIQVPPKAGSTSSFATTVVVYDVKGGRFRFVPGGSLPVQGAWFPWPSGNAREVSP